MSDRSYYTYILMNKNNTVNYTGITNDLARRIFEHKNDLVEGFTRRYRVHKLVYYEEYDDVNTALNREKEIKGWTKKRKFQLVFEKNPEFLDLYEDID